MEVIEAKKKVLVVDDETSIRESLRLMLGRFYSVDVAENGEQALKLLEATNQESVKQKFPDIVLLDVMMPGVDGISVLRQVKNKFPKVPVIMLTASKGVRNAVEAMKIGAVDYLNKPFDVDELLSLIEETLRDGAVGREAPSVIVTSAHDRSNIPTVEGTFGQLVGNHPLMQELYEKIEQLAKRDTTVLITGESGTGKELVAAEIHRRSPRAKAPFAALNCAAIPETLIESELFGHEKGAFTHAVEGRRGHFELADKGTLFLDEIGELGLSVQVKMLRFLQEREFYPVGRSTPIHVDVRIIAATNKNLENSIKVGTFRQDLYYRINVVTLEIPPLRERVEDIDVLVDHFISRFKALYGERKVGFNAQAMKILKSYAWPGNVRELENVTESVLALCAKEIITPEDLPSRLKSNSNGGNLSERVVDGGLTFDEAERAFETEIILRALKKANFVQTKAADLLGISRRILKYKMDKLGIKESE